MEVNANTSAFIEFKRVYLVARLCGGGGQGVATTKTAARRLGRDFVAHVSKYVRSV